VSRTAKLLLRLLPLALQAWLGLRAWRALAALPAVTPDTAAATVPDGAAPLVSIIIPARNEARTLPRLIPSLLAQQYPAFEVLVVDDESTDGTASVARAHGARVVSAGPLPAGWVGKPHACAVGAAAARGEWLLFTDADTWHAPDSLATALHYVRSEALEALSLFTRQECGTLWERLLLPYAYQQFFAGVDAHAVNDPRHGSALLNGQYLLIRRDAYARAGGHASVQNSIVEDVAFGALLKRSGVYYRFARGEALVSVRMYHGLRAIIAGFSKNSFRFARQEPRRGALVILSTLLSAAPVFAALNAIRRGRLTETLWTIFPGYLIGVAALAPWQRRCATHTALPLAQPLSALLFQAIAFGGLWSALGRGRTRWKGRRY